MVSKRKVSKSRRRSKNKKVSKRNIKKYLNKGGGEQNLNPFEEIIRLKNEINELNNENNSLLSEYNKLEKKIKLLEKKLSKYNNFCTNCGHSCLKK